MEKQKIFWVILSVTVFVVVVLAVGLFLLKRGPDGLAIWPAAPVAAEPAPDAPTGLYEFGRDAPSVEGDTEVLRFVIGGSETAETDAGSEGSGPAAASSATVRPAAPAPVKPAAKPVATAPAPAPAKPAATATAPAKPAVSARGPEYWIQTGSYRSQTRAEELSQSLAARGLAGRVFSYAKSNETYFRVRIGPYTNKQEAEKFLDIVRKIQGLEASYISLVGGSGSAN